ncbi:MAG: thiol-disulfide oxidoreductase DCC family protein [Thermoplasmata archaeon]|nr:thiol-disulfide oxidoreductase DCC family protein [Thermoplasmata archaeon]
MQSHAEHPVVLFDGVCNLCNAYVNFLIDRDPGRKLRFASLQSTEGQGLLRDVGHRVPEGDPESIVLVDRGRVYERSAAALRIARHMSGAWPLLSALWVIPAPLRDVVYRWVAANRYRWFGKSEVCRVPTPELRDRFL